MRAKHLYWFKNLLIPQNCKVLELLFSYYNTGWKCTENDRGVWTKCVVSLLYSFESQPNTYLQALPTVRLGTYCLNAPNDETSLFPICFTFLPCSFMDPQLTMQNWEACDAQSPQKHITPLQPYGSDLSKGWPWSLIGIPFMPHDNFLSLPLPPLLELPPLPSRAPTKSSASCYICHHGSSIKSLPSYVLVSGLSSLLLEWLSLSFCLTHLCTGIRHL